MWPVQKSLSHVVINQYDVKYRPVVSTHPDERHPNDIGVVCNVELESGTSQAITWRWHKGLTDFVHK